MWAARVEAPHRARSGPQVQRRQCVDLAGMGFRGDWPEDPLRLVHAGAVVRLDAAQVRFDDAARRDLLLEDCLLELPDGRFLHVETRRARLRRLKRIRVETDRKQQHEPDRMKKSARHRRAA
jgi:hypothetical protein